MHSRIVQESDPKVCSKDIFQDYDAIVSSLSRSLLARANATLSCPMMYLEEALQNLQQSCVEKAAATSAEARLYAMHCFFEVESPTSCVNRSGITYLRHEVLTFAVDCFYEVF